MLLTAAGSGLGGEEVEPELLGAVSTLGSGTRAIAVWPQRWAERGGPPCVYLHGVGDPGNVGTIVRTAHALLGGVVVARARLRRSLLAEGGAGEHGLDLRPARRRGPAVEATPAPRVALVAHGGEPVSRRSARRGDLCLGAEREGLPAEVLDACDARVTIPLRAGGAESLNVAAAAAIARSSGYRRPPCRRPSEDA